MKAVREEKTAEFQVTEQLSLATPLTSVYWAPLERFATILPRMLYNSVMAVSNRTVYTIVKNCELQRKEGYIKSLFKRKKLLTEQCHIFSDSFLVLLSK